MSPSIAPADRAEYYRRIETHGLAPLWEDFSNLLTPVPAIRSAPHLWDYEALRPLILESGSLISAKEAERRVLILENPGLKGDRAITESLYAGWQLITPGESAPAHRHTPAALRLVVEGGGAYTAVDGERAYMTPGDLIITPSWAWHDHGHEGQGPVVWLDVLDLPTVIKLGLVFTEHYPEDHYPQSRAPGDNLARFGMNMAPVGIVPEQSGSALFRYPYDRARSALEQLKVQSDWDPCHGLKLEYINPSTGGPAMRTISTFVQLLPFGLKTQPYQTTEGIIFSVIEGRGRVTIHGAAGKQTLPWKVNDVFVVPCWQRFDLEADEEAVLFSASDKAIQAKLGLWRERRLI